MSQPARCAEQPVSRVVWRQRETLTRNDYNPNKVAPPQSVALVQNSTTPDCMHALL